MTFWNLLVVLCFTVLYLGVALVFIQVRRLRDDVSMTRLKPDAVPSVDRDVNVDVDDADGGLDLSAQVLLERINTLEAALSAAIKKSSERLSSDLESVRGDMRYMSSHAPPMPSGMNAQVGQSKNDAYREARLLLANGVDEERVLEETGLTVEEVSLLKRIAHQSPEGKIVSELNGRQ